MKKILVGAGALGCIKRPSGAGKTEIPVHRADIWVPEPTETEGERENWQGKKLSRARDSQGEGQRSPSLNGRRQ